MRHTWQDFAPINVNWTSYLLFCVCMILGVLFCRKKTVDGAWEQTYKDIWFWSKWNNRRREEIINKESIVCVLLCEIWDSYSILANVSERWCCVVGWADSNVSEDGSTSIYTVRHSKKIVFFAQNSTVFTSKARRAGHAARVFEKRNTFTATRET